MFGGGASERQTLLLNYLVWLFGEKSAQPKRNQSLVAGAGERNIHISIVGVVHRESYEGTRQDSLGLFHVSETRMNVERNVSDTSNNRAIFISSSPFSKCIKVDMMELMIIPCFAVVAR